MHVGDRAGLHALVDVLRHLGDEQVLGVLGEHARHVERDVAVAEHGDRCRVERPLARHVRVPVEPADVVGRTVGGDRVDAGDVERGVADRAGREDHGVVVLLEVVEGDVLAEAHVAEQADVPAVEHIAQRVDDALDAGVIGATP